MPDVRGLTDDDDGLSLEQRDAVWKWRWLGLRQSTPAFKACLALLAAVAFALAAYSMVPVR